MRVRGLPADRGMGVYKGVSVCYKCRNGDGQKKPRGHHRRWTERGLSRGLLIQHSITMGPSQQYFFNQIREAISSDRMASYLARFNQCESQLYGAYAWNIALCESLYPALQGIEITLRNSINDAAVAEFAKQDWYLTNVDTREPKTVNYTTSVLKTKGKQLTTGNYVAEFTFGFWVSLFDGRYHHSPWSRALTSIFTHMPNSNRSMKDLRTRLERIRRLRNRVLHHEPI